MLGASISLASTLSGPAADKATESTMDAAPASLLPGLVDTSVAYTDTGNASPAAAGAANFAVAQAPAPAATALNARVASGELVAGASDTALPDHNGCMPEPVSIMLMTSGLAGLIVARRFRR
jgi:hypothetical protein